MLFLAAGQGRAGPPGTSGAGWIHGSEGVGWYRGDIVQRSSETGSLIRINSGYDVFSVATWSAWTRWTYEVGLTTGETFTATRMTVDLERW